MALPKQLELALRGLGLTEHESRVYALLTKSAEYLPPEEIADSCGLSVDQARAAIESLLGKGLIDVESNRFSSLQPKVALEALVDGRERELREKMERLRTHASTAQRLLEPAYWEARSGMKPEELLEPLGDLTAMEVRTVQMLGRARREALIFTGRFDWYDKVSEVLAEALDRGAKVRVLMRATDDVTRRRAEELTGLGVEVRQPAEEWYPIRGTLVDKRELTFLIWATRKDVRRPLFFRPCYTTNLGLIEVFFDAFENRWGRAGALGGEGPSQP